MIDTDKYQGHDNWEGTKVNMANEANKLLIADAPLLLAEVERLREEKTFLWKTYLKENAEVKRLRGLLMKGSEDYTTSYMDLRGIIEDVHWELTGDEHESNEARIKYALIALSEVIG